eukprot:31474-Pelagococcus_subviridis.AAC.6
MRLVSILILFDDVEVSLDDRARRRGRQDVKSSRNGDHHVANGVVRGPTRDAPRARACPGTT